MFLASSYERYEIDSNQDGMITIHTITIRVLSIALQHRLWRSATILGVSIPRRDIWKRAASSGSGARPGTCLSRSTSPSFGLEGMRRSPRTLGKSSKRAIAPYCDRLFLPIWTRQLRSLSISCSDVFPWPPDESIYQWIAMPFQALVLFSSFSSLLSFLSPHLALFMCRNCRLYADEFTWFKTKYEKTPY